MFITTANVLDTIPGPLRDRMEVIDLPGYVEDEKFEIARRYLVDRQLKANGLTAEQAEVTDAAVRAIIRDYTREAGVRQLEREIGAVLRSAAMRIAEGIAQHVRIEPGDLVEILGPPRFEGEVAMRTSVPGVATGLAWTPVGGIKEKDVAAARAGLATVILPARNRKDYEEVPEAARNVLRFIWAERVEEVIEGALEPAAEPTPAVAA